MTADQTREQHLCLVLQNLEGLIMDDLYFNLKDVYKTLKANELLDIKRVHGGTENEDTLGDLVEDTFYKLFNENIGRAK
jgi:hypothetical protein